MSKFNIFLVVFFIVMAVVEFTRGELHGARIDLVIVVIIIESVRVDYLNEATRDMLKLLRSLRRSSIFLSTDTRPATIP